MLIYKNGDLLDSNQNIICHQVNVNGIMGGGLARQIAEKYPKVEEKYKLYCKLFQNDYEKLKGIPEIVKINNTQYIANCFTQKLNFDTDYQSIENCFDVILNLCKASDMTVAIPYKYGCGIANGNWDKLEKIFEKLSKNYEIDIFIYKLN